MEDVFGAAPMQVDDSTRLVPQSTDRTYIVADNAVEIACDKLAHIIRADDDSARIKQWLGVVWFVVWQALEGVEGRLPSLKAFQDNVEHNGESQFIDSLRDMARRNSWRDLFENGNFPKCFRR
jgi:hypothetical protein